MREGVKWVHSDSLGLIRFSGGEFSLSDASANWPAVTKLLVQWLHEQCPEEFGA